MTPDQKAVLWFYTYPWSSVPQDMATRYCMLRGSETLDILEWLLANEYMKIPCDRPGYVLTDKGRAALAETNRVRVVTRRTPCTL